MGPNRTHTISAMLEGFVFLELHFIILKVGVGIFKKNSTKILALRRLLKLGVEGV
jgi:hypothetical protein